MQSLYARAWYSKALALLNLKNPIGSEKNFEKALEAFDALTKPWKLLKRLLLLTRKTSRPATLRGLLWGI